MPDTALTDQLLPDVKSYLHVTWADDNTDKNVRNFINSSVTRLQEIAGAPLDFTVEGIERDLLFDRCRYANSHALEMFEKNFSSELVSLHIKYQVAAMEDDTTV